MDYTYQTHGVCSRQITFTLKDGVLSNVRFFGGCPGNLLGIGKLVEGAKAEDVVNKLSGLRCGGKPTSCPDQLATAVRQALDAEKDGN